jgi:hypothetical protein
MRLPGVREREHFVPGECFQLPQQFAVGQMYPGIGVAIFVNRQEKDTDQKQKYQEQARFCIFPCVCANLRGNIMIAFETMKKMSRHIP